MESRTKDSYQTFLRSFLKFDILVSCPNCSKKAIVKPKSIGPIEAEQSDVKVICPNCGYNKILTEKPESILVSTSNRKIAGRYLILGSPIDPYFNLPLWLQASFEENTLWAYNLEHLEFLQNHVESKLRERNGQELFNSSLGSRLPKWMISKKNRESLLKKIKELKSK